MPSSSSSWLPVDRRVRFGLSLACLVAALVPALGAAPQSARPRQGESKGRAILRNPDQFHPSSAYYLVAPQAVKSTYLVDDHLRVVHEWQSDYPPGLSAYLRDDGSLLRTATIPNTPFSGENGGRVELYTWNGAFQWGVEYNSDRAQQHHDAILLPNGHVLMIALETRTAGEAIEAGRSPETLPDGPEIWVDTLVEMDPQTSAVTWTWRIWDHLVPPGARPADYPGLIDPNFAVAQNPDWTHCNAVAYNADLDEVMISTRHLSEIWIIDHSTTSDEATGHTGGRRGHGGDLLYRWGNPASYGRPGPQQLYGQHNAQWIPAGLPGAGHILMFNNGDKVLRPWSTAVEIVPPVQDDGLYTFDDSVGYGPSAPVWQYTADPPQSLYGTFASGVQRLANGNTLISVTPTGRFREVTPDGQVLRDYQLELAGAPLEMFRVNRFEPRLAGVCVVDAGTDGGNTRRGADVPAVNDERGTTNAAELRARPPLSAVAYCFFAVNVPSTPATAIDPFNPPSSPSVPVNTRWYVVPSWSLSNSKVTILSFTAPVTGVSLPSRVAVPDSVSPSCFQTVVNFTGLPTTSPSTFQVPATSAARTVTAVRATATIASASFLIRTSGEWGNGHRFCQLIVFTVNTKTRRPAVPGHLTRGPGRAPRPVVRLRRR